jgi:hypothetical protein
MSPRRDAPILLTGAILALAGLCGCNPIALTTFRVSPPLAPAADGGGAAPVLHVTAAGVDDVAAIAKEVAERHGLEAQRATEPGVVSTYTRHWEFPNDGHARSIRVSVSRSAEAPDVIEVTVFEWQSYGPSDMGRQLLEELGSSLRERFGPDAVS